MKKTVIAVCAALGVILCAVLCAVIFLKSYTPPLEWEGDGVSVRLDGDGTATVTGEGVTPSLETICRTESNDKKPKDLIGRLLRSVKQEAEIPVKKLVLGPGITGLGNDSLLHCGNLREIAVDGENPYLASIDGVLFNREKTVLLYYPPARSGADYTVPDSVTEIGGAAFSGNLTLKTVRLPDGLEFIRYDAFSGCANLTEAALPDSLAAVSDHAFEGCSSLTEIEIPAGMKRIGDCAFKGCDSLAAFTSATQDAAYYAADGVLFRRKNRVLVQYPNGSGRTEYAVPEGVTEIGDCAFYGNGTLTLVTFPESLTKIGQFSFADCAALQSVALPDTMGSIGLSAFENCVSLSEVHLGKYLRSIGMQAFLNCPRLLTVEVPKKTDFIGFCSLGYTGTVGKNKYVKGFSILCEEGSTAQRYAENNNIAYELI